MPRPRAAVGQNHFAGCNECWTLDGTSARQAPHDALQLIETVQTESGLREVYSCKGCGQRMQRFVAKQTNPLPSDRWRVG